jgi:hypothetical protein
MNHETSTQNPEDENVQNGAEWQNMIEEPEPEPTPELATETTETSEDLSQLSSEQIKQKMTDIEDAFAALKKIYGDNIPGDIFSRMGQDYEELNAAYNDARAKETADLLPEDRRQNFLDNIGREVFRDKIMDIIQKKAGGMSDEDIKAELYQLDYNGGDDEVDKARADSLFDAAVAYM